MITVITSSREPQEEFKEHIIKTSGIKNIEFLSFKNNGEYSLTEIYNKGLKEAKNDIIVFCHDDIEINKNGWGYKLLENFQKNPEYGILGVAGSSEITDSGVWWSRKESMYGRVSHKDTQSGKVWDSNFSKSRGNSIKEVVVLDGVFFAIDRRKIKCGFNEDFDGFHYYDLSFTFENYLAGVSVGVFTNIKITHNSVGVTNDKWEINRKKFVDKFSDKLPQTAECEILYKDFNVKIKKEPKLAIIIPTKNKFELLSGCIDSILNTTKYKNFKIYIADTGSCPETKELIRKDYLKYDNIELIEYDYYNYAKINNDVVKNKIDEDTEIVIFSNNDIELINDSISIMVDTYLNNKNKVGTVGCRLHYESGLIQHMGILAYRKEGMLILTHSALNYDFSEIDVTNTIKLYGNTAAFMLMNKKLFEKYGGFNEEYEICFEDVELNFRALMDNKINFTCTNAVNYHFESQTRGKTISQNDYQLILKYTTESGLLNQLKENPSK